MKKVIIDVREPEEFARDHVEGAINIPPSQLMEGAHQLDDVEKDSELIVYCITGARSTVAKNILGSLGFTNVTNGINKDHVQQLL